MGQDSIISQSFHFCCFRVLLKKKKKRTQFLKFWNTLALCPSPEVRLAFLLLHLSCPWVDSVGEGGPAFTHFQSAWRRSSVSCPRHQAQWALGDYLLPPGGLPVLSPSGTLLPPSAASCTDGHTLQVLWCGWFLRLCSFVVILINIFYSFKQF